VDSLSGAIDLCIGLSMRDYTYSSAELRPSVSSLDSIQAYSILFKTHLSIRSTHFQTLYTCNLKQTQLSVSLALAT
jgi:hypothetical protein